MLTKGVGVIRPREARCTPARGLWFRLARSGNNLTVSRVTDASRLLFNNAPKANGGASLPRA